jgi:hypothetical protein
MNSPYERMDVDLMKYPAGIYMVELKDADGKLLGQRKCFTYIKRILSSFIH